MLRIVLSTGLCLCMICASLVQAEGTGKKKLSIGAVLSLTGEGANNGEAIRKGIALAAEDLQAKNWSVDVNVQDDATNPVKTVSAVQFLLSQNYQIFVGPTWSFLTKAAIPLFERAESVAMVPAGSSDVNGGQSNTVFNLHPKRESQLGSITEWIRSRQSRRAFILSPLGDWGVVHRAVFQEAAKQAGVEVVGDMEFDYGIETSALKTIVLTAKSKGADLLLTTASGSDLSNILKFRSQLRWSTAVLTTENLWDAVDAGLVALDSPMLLDVWVIGLPVNPDFYRRFFARFNESPKVYADRAYDAVMLLAEAVSKTDGSPAAIRKYLSAQKSFKGITGNIQFSGLNDRVSEDYMVMTALNNKSRS